MSTKTNNTDQLSTRRKFYFKLFSLFFSVLILVIFELLLRLFSYGDNLNLFIDHPNPKYKNFYLTNPKIGEKYFSTFDATSGSNDIFLKKKPENGFRIFVMGSSTVVGFPYNRNLMFSRILKKRLQDAYPDKRIEVINTAITAINSITLNDYMHDIVKHDPDAILFYAGHNEFYGAFGIGSNETMSKNKFLRNFHFKFIKLRTYQLVRSIIQKIASAFGNSTNIANQKGSLMKKIVKDKDILYGGELYQLGIKQYKENLSNILSTAKKEEIPVFIGDLVCNVKDIAPFGNDSAAHEAYNNALQVLTRNDTAKAQQLFYKAKDLDPVRFRASEEINTIIDSLSQINNCYFTPVKEQFLAFSADGLIGNNLLTEHVHPNIDGQFQMADAFFKTIIQSQLIAQSTSEIASAEYYRSNWYYTPLDSLIANYRVRQLKSYWPFTSLDNDITFVETFKPQTPFESFAFSAIINPKINEEVLHDSLAQQYFDSKDFPAALKEFEVLTTMIPSSVNYSNQAAQCYLELNDLYQSEKHLTHSIEYIPTYYAHLMLGEINAFKLDLKKAVYHYEKAVKLSNKEEDEKVVLLRLHKLYTQTENKEKLTSINKKLSKEKIELPKYTDDIEFLYSNFIPSNIESLIHKAKVSASNNQPDSALFYLTQALEINNCPLVNKLIGDQLFIKKDNRLIHYYSRAYNDYQYSSSFLVSYCIAKYVNKDIQGANDVFDELEKLDPENNEIDKLKKLLNRS